MERKYIIAYDICESRRLNRVAKVMKNYGHRVQKSIFEASLTSNQLKILKKQLIKEMDADIDGVKFFKLCSECEQKLSIIGKGTTTDLFQKVVII
jgi:CRISPR-associated protein Cas2